MIRVLVCDGEGTLHLPRPTDEIHTFLDSLDEMGIALAVASNRTRSEVVSRFRKARLPVPDHIVTRYDTGNPKPSPLFIGQISAMTGVPPNEMVYLGDDDNTDMYCAINSGVLPLNASYSTDPKPRNYGIPVSSPTSVLRFLRTFGQQPTPHFGWMYRGIFGETGKVIDVRAILDNHTWEPDIARVLKGEPVRDGDKEKRIKTVLGLALISSCYQSGLMQEVDWITVYPGHEVDSQNPLVKKYSLRLSRLFRNKLVDDLLIRHKTAPQSRLQRERRNIYSQFDTISVNPLHKAKIQGQRVLVVDDFTTYGYSLETARRMLTEAGCASAVTIAFGKFRDEYSLTIFPDSWDPYNPFPFGPEKVSFLRIRGNEDGEDFDAYFRDVIWPEYVG